MKNRFIISILTAIAILFAASQAEAQVPTRKERRSVEKYEKYLNKQIKDKSIKQARKEAKKLAKQGYKVPTGKLPMDKQLERAWQLQYVVDENGYPFYFVASAKTIGSSYSAAQMQAVNIAKMDLAGQIQTRVNQLIEAKIANNEISQEDAASLNSFVSASKSVISNTLGRVLILVEIYRTLENGNNEVQVTLGYNSELAMEEAIKAVQKTMGQDADKLMKQLDSLIFDEE